MPRLAKITELTTIDQLIIGILVLFLFVFAFELFLVVPCGGWENLEGCNGASADAAKADWQGYYDIDPHGSV